MKKIEITENKLPPKPLKREHHHPPHEHHHGKGRLLPAALVMLGLFGAGFFPGYYYYQGKVNANYVTVKGLAEKEVKADLAVWEMRIVATGDELSEVQKSLNRQLLTIKDFLHNNNISDSEISEGRIDTNDLTTNPYLDKYKSRYILTQNITVRSKNVDNISASLQKTGELISRGITFDSQQYSSPVSYIFTGLNGIKAEMLSEATANAYTAAEEFAKNSHSSVGKIRYANQGVFSILPQIQTDTSSEIQQINKTVQLGYIKRMLSRKTYRSRSFGGGWGRSAYIFSFGCGEFRFYRRTDDYYRPEFRSKRL